MLKEKNLRIDIEHGGVKIYKSSINLYKVVIILIIEIV